MNLGSIWAQIEQEQLWRVDEIRFFDNQVEKLESQIEQDQFRRANILLLYSHYEGFCKFAFTMYVDTVNAQQLKCKEANFALAAASLDRVFKDLRNSDSKTTEFKSTLPDDRKLHVFARDREFLARIIDYNEQPVLIPEEVVDTESNLKPIVLRKNLYRLGFPHDGLEIVEGFISMLLNARNEIAHGVTGRGITSGKYDRLRYVTFIVMDKVKRYVMNALDKREFLRA